jgi:ribonuclease R
LSKESHHAQSQVWRQLIRGYLASHPDRSMKTRALARVLEINESDYTDFRRFVRQLVKDGVLILGPRRSLLVPDASGQDELVGTFRATDRGFGFVEVPGQKDIYIPLHLKANAREGDRVAVRAKPSRDPERGDRGEVLRIIERATLRWVGVLERSGRQWFVEPRGKGQPTVQIDDPTAKSAQPGDLVIIEPLEATLQQRVPRGVIVERLGDTSESLAIIKALIHQHAIPDAFSPEVSSAAQQAAADFDPNQDPQRRDIRDLLTITIDPFDARDFDDAITIENLREGRIRLGVHIADVAHFVRPGTPLDEAAYERGNSVYFPQHVVPMLPEVLSNGVCSLQPGVDRFAKSAWITLDRDAQVLETQFSNSLMRSNARLTYEQVRDALDEGLTEEIEPEVLGLLKAAETLAKRIQKRRKTAGMLVLNLPEVELEFDNRRRVMGSHPADQSFSHTIIEMFMVEANEAVCRLFAQRKISHLRRIHPPPDPNDAGLLMQLRPLIGRSLPDELTRESMHALLKTVRGKPEEAAVSLTLLRSLSQATYSPELEGHFALASEHYCHFTSPIRRYPDLVIHRLLDAYLREQDTDEALSEADDPRDLALVGRHCSSTERRAQQAERDAQQALLLNFLRDHIGERFSGTVTNVTSFGAFVQIEPILAEGLVRVGDFGPDVWEFEREYACFYGMHHRQLVCIGMRVEVEIQEVNPLAGELTLVPVPDVPFGLSRAKTSTKPGKTQATRPKPSRGRRGKDPNAKQRGRKRGRRR